MASILSHPQCANLRILSCNNSYTKHKTEPETPVNVQLPSGLVRAFVETKDGKTGPQVRSTSVPVFAVELGWS